MAIGADIPQTESPMKAFMERLDQEKKNKLIQAQAQREQAKANMPFGGVIPPGPAGQTMGLEMLKTQFGENSPQYKQAKSMYDLNQHSTQSRVNYQDILSNTANKRFSTGLAKTTQELEDIKNGYLPGTKTPLTEEQKQTYEGMYGNDLLKKTTDSDTRKKNLYSHNIDITLGQIDPKSLTQYSGLQGGMKLIQDKANALRGNVRPEYKAYENSLTNAKLLKKQVRQFYGDSITPTMDDRLEQLTNPSTWLKNPEIAMNNFNSFVKTLRAESKTYQEAAQSPSVYGAKHPQSEYVSPEVGEEGQAENPYANMSDEELEAIANAK